MTSSPRVAIVTGAASGIGRATVEALVGDGCCVVAVDRDGERLSWCDGDARIAVVGGDVTDPAVDRRAVATAVECFGGLDAAVLNAGVAAGGDLLDLSMEVFDRSIDVNVRSLVHGIRAVVPPMRERGGGRIVVTASTSGIAGDPRMWAYNAAKAAAINLVRSAAIDLAADGITVNAVCPGPTETGMTARLLDAPAVYEEVRRAIPMQRWAVPHEIAAVIAFFASPAVTFVTGAVIPVDGGITANTGQFRPRPAADLPAPTARSTA